jgi:hypothetical protein
MAVEEDPVGPECQAQEFVTEPPTLKVNSDSTSGRLNLKWREEGRPESPDDLVDLFEEKIGEWLLLQTHCSGLSSKLDWCSDVLDEVRPGSPKTRATARICSMAASSEIAPDAAAL